MEVWGLGRWGKAVKGPGWGEGHEAERGFGSCAKVLREVSGWMGEHAGRCWGTGWVAGG